MNDFIKKVFRTDLLNYKKWHQKGLELITTTTFFKPMINEYWINEHKRDELKHFYNSYLVPAE